ncbi:cyclin-dependent kinase 1-like [Stylophora pistillata]|nr:cyclin-dependent kinase 1-like [Stylophora pistillata]
MAFNDFDPLDFGFNVVDISKGEKYFLQRSDEPTSEEGFKVVFPNADAQSSSLILHPPSEVWGYDDKQLILGVVSSCHMSSNAWYVWYRDGIQIKAGNKHCCPPVSSPGSYHIAVHCGEEKTTSEPVLVCDLSDLGPPSVSAFDTSAKANVPQLPVVEKGEINFSAKDELGRGSFGVVYKGVWAGTEVAVKLVKIRNAKGLQRVVETEVRIHSMIRHPNNVQIMAISYLKNSIYLVSELINGRNLEELLFNDDENSDNFTLQSCNKYDVGKQVSLAVAYLHNLKPPLLHCDIKPANVLVAEKTHITKLCDMGLSKLKSAQSLTHTTSSAIRGTPSYMAPECLLERKKAAVHPDVWSLACTFVELFTERECWEQLLEGKEEAAGRKSDDAESDVESLIAIMRKKECPRSIEFSPETVDASLRGILVDCFKYETELRPRAIDLVNAFP